MVALLREIVCALPSLLALSFRLRIFLPGK
jgi:hypothetical protein